MPSAKLYTHRKSEGSVVRERVPPGPVSCHRRCPRPAVQHSSRPVVNNTAPGARYTSLPPPALPLSRPVDAGLPRGRPRRGSTRPIRAERTGGRSLTIPSGGRCPATGRRARANASKKMQHGTCSTIRCGARSGRRTARQGANDGTGAGDGGDGGETGRRRRAPRAARAPRPRCGRRLQRSRSGVEGPVPCGMAAWVHERGARAGRRRREDGKTAACST
jgi:hypothetical protein